MPGSVFWRIYLLLDGSSMVRLNGRCHTLTPGHLYIIPAFTTHEDILQGTFVHKYIHFRLDDPILEEILDGYELPFEINADQLAYCIFERFDALCPDFILETCIPADYEKKSSYLYWTKRYLSLPIEVRLELENCVKLLISQFINKGKTVRYQNNREMLRVKGYIESHLTEDIHVSDLAALSNMRTESFIRAFHKAYKQTPHSYITEKRINEAKNLLLLTTLSIKEIAAKVGFKSASHFCMIFKKYTSFSPNGFRTS